MVESLQNPYVYVVKDNILEKRAVVIHKDLGNRLMIESGIQEGEEVVISGLVNVREGSKVNPLRPQAAPVQ